MKIVSWNVNGLARCRRNGFLKFLADAKPDVLCCQEIKGECPLKTPGCLSFWNPAKRNNYSGTLVLSRRQPLSCQYGLGIEKFDDEGRLITLEYKDYFIVNVYAPNLNPHSTPDRLDFRIEWDKAVRGYVTKLPKPTIMCGDFNVTREYIDIYPENQKNTSEEPLFQSEQRAGFALHFPSQPGAFLLLLVNPWHTALGPSTPARAGGLMGAGMPLLTWVSFLSVTWQKSELQI